MHIHINQIIPKSGLFFIILSGNYTSLGSLKHAIKYLSKRKNISTNIVHSYNLNFHKNKILVFNHFI